MDLDLDGLTVLIGDNGVGKSTIIEGLELLHRVTRGDDFIASIHDVHGGLGLVTHGRNHVSIGLDVTDGVTRWSYDVKLQSTDGGMDVADETLVRDREVVFHRQGLHVAVSRLKNLPTFDAMMSTAPIVPLLAMFGESDVLTACLDGIDVYGPFATTAAWLRQGQESGRSARQDNVLQQTARLARGGTNLANAFNALRQRDDWKDTLETVQVVVDNDIRDVRTPISESGNVGLLVEYRTGTVPAHALSDGTLALLALVAVTTFDGDVVPRSMLVLDEPDLHLHPGAIQYLVTLLERCAERYPVVIATHSDHLLDCLTAPERSTVLCDLDEHRHLRLRRPDPPALARWLRDYRGMGHLRAEGYAGFAFPPPSRAADGR